MPPRYFPYIPRNMRSSSSTTSNEENRGHGTNRLSFGNMHIPISANFHGPGQRVSGGNGNPQQVPHDSNTHGSENIDVNVNSNVNRTSRSFRMSQALSTSNGRRNSTFISNINSEMSSGSKIYINGNMMSNSNTSTNTDTAIPPHTPPSVSTNSSTNPVSCPICMETLSSSSDVAIVQPCNHEFCRSCIMAWIRTQRGRSELQPSGCPICRGVIQRVFQRNGRAVEDLRDEVASERQRRVEGDMNYSEMLEAAGRYGWIF